MRHTILNYGKCSPYLYSIKNPRYVKEWIRTNGKGLSFYSACAIACSLICFTASTYALDFLRNRRVLSERFTAKLGLDSTWFLLSYNIRDIYYILIYKVYVYVSYRLATRDHRCSKYDCGRLKSTRWTPRYGNLWCKLIFSKELWLIIEWAPTIEFDKNVSNE